MSTAYVFDCPVHGRESGVFCFRAFAPENKKRWKKLQIESKEVFLSDEERNEELDALLKRITHA